MHHVVRGRILFTSVMGHSKALNINSILKKCVVFLLMVFTYAGALQIGGTAEAQTSIQRAPAQTIKPGQRTLQVLPKLQVQIFSKEFEEWGPSLVIYAPRTLHFRWGYPAASASARWELSDAPYPNPNVLLSGTMSAAPNVWNRFSIDLEPVLPATPPPANQPKTYYVRVFPQGSNLAATQIVTISYKAYGETTKFGDGAVFPSLEIVEIGDVGQTGPNLVTVDVMLRITNNNNKATDPFWLKVADGNVLFRQNAAPVSLSPLQPNASINRTMRLEAILPPPPNIRPSGSQQIYDWFQQNNDRCGPIFRGILDWRGPQSQTPIDAHRNVLLPREGWADYTKIAPSTRVCYIDSVDPSQSACVRTCEMEKAIRARLDGKVVGYAYVIVGGSPVFGAGGNARTAVDGGPIPFTTKTHINVASVSKWITAIATMRVMEENSIQFLADPIGPYFPSDWDVDPYFQDLNFGQLLSQRSGIRIYGSSNLQYDALKAFFEQSVDTNAPADAPCPGASGPSPDILVSPNAAMSTDFDESNCYSNYNTAIMRLLLPRAAGLAEDANTGTRAQTLADQYEQIVRDKVFKPVGVTDVGCRPMGSEPHAFYYLYPGSQKGADPGDKRLGCGATHWTISVEDMAKVLSSINALDEKILTENAVSSQSSPQLPPLAPPGATPFTVSLSQFDEMRRFRLGLDISGGSMMEKNGGFGGKDKDDDTVVQLSTSAAIFGPVTGPNLIGVILLNSNVNSAEATSARSVMKDAYDGALTPP